MKIRRINSNEVELVRQQRLTAYEEYKERVSNDHWEGLKRTLSSESDWNSETAVYVAEVDNEVVGSVVLFPAKAEAYPWLPDASEYPEIRMLAVAPHAREKGIGKSLLKYCINKARTEGHAYIGLHTAEFMKSAILLYEKMGFERVPEQDFEPAEDGIVVKGFKLNMAVSKNLI